MKRSVIAAFLGLALSWSQTSAAQPETPPEASDVPSGPGTLSGEVVHPQADPGEQHGAGIEVLLYALPGSGTPGIRHGRTDERGAFRFEGISNDPETVYLVGARYRGVPFPGARVQFKPGQNEEHVKVRIGELSEDASALRLLELEMQLEWRGGLVQVTEVYRVDNGGVDVAYVPDERRVAERALFEMTLPAAADNFGSPFGLPLEGVIRDGDRIRFFGPIYPSGWGGAFSQRQEIAVRYELPAQDTAFVLQKRLLAGVERVVLYGGAGFEALEVEGATATEEDGVRVWVLSGAARGDVVTARSRFPEAQRDRSAMTRRQTRVFLELDGAALSVREEHLFHIAGSAPLLAAGDEPLFEIAIPGAARDLRFSPEASNWGLEHDDGVLRLRGPLPVGEQQFDVAYQLPRNAPAIAYHFQSAPAIPLLSLFIADTGLLIGTDRLHRRRPVAAGTRTYAHWEGFQIDAGSRIEVALRPLRGSPATPRALVSGTGAVLAALAALLLLAPLGGDRGTLQSEAVDPARLERNAIYAALRDLEHDYETGKVSDPDFAALRAELRGRAAALFEREEAGTTPDSVTLPNLPACPSCAEMTRPGDRFCSQCGATLEPVS